MNSYIGSPSLLSRRTISSSSLYYNYVYALKARLKMMVLASRIGWRAVYKHFNIDHKCQGETRKKIEDVFGEDMDSDI